MAKIDQIAHRPLSDSQIIEELCFVFWGELSHRFEFHDQTPESKKVGDVVFLQLPAFVMTAKLRLCLIGDTS